MRDDISKQIQNSQIFFNVGRYCHFFGWAPRKRLVSFRDQWKCIFIWRLLSFHLLVRVLAVSLRELWEERATRWIAGFVVGVCFVSVTYCRFSVDVYDWASHQGYCILNCWFLFQFPPSVLFFLIPFRVSIIGFF